MYVCVTNRQTNSQTDRPIISRTYRFLVQKQGFDSRFQLVSGPPTVLLLFLCWHTPSGVGGTGEGGGDAEVV